MKKAWAFGYKNILLRDYIQKVEFLYADNSSHPQNQQNGKQQNFYND